MNTENNNVAGHQPGAAVAACYEQLHEAADDALSS